MIQHIFKIIWSERKSNIWILLELILVFSILWFCVDFLFFMGKRYLEPRGFDVEHTYKIGIGMKDRSFSTLSDSLYLETLENNSWIIYDRIKKYPGIESVSLSQNAYPYAGSYSGDGFLVDTTTENSQIKRVTPEFFDVFKIKITDGNVFTKEQAVSSDIAMISPGRNNKFNGKEPRSIQEISRVWGEDRKIKITGVVEKSKRSEYDNYQQIVYEYLRLWNQNNNSTTPNFNEFIHTDIYVRVKPDADKDFVESFTKDMRDQLEVEPYFLINVVPTKQFRNEYLAFTGLDNRLKNVLAITGFLILNIFLGVIGTFWFRIQSRRSEIGLRIALGASRKKLKTMFSTETLLLLFIASIVASIISVNIGMTNLLGDIGLPTIDSGTENNYRYFIIYGITFALLAIISLIAVWYPAKQASETPPAEVLRNE